MEIPSTNTPSSVNADDAAKAVEALKDLAANANDEGVRFEASRYILDHFEELQA